MVSNDMPSAPNSRALCSSSAATSTSAHAGPDEAQDVLKELTAGQGGLNHQGQLVFVLDAPQGFHHGRGQSGKKRAPQPGRESGLPAGQLGNGGPCGVESGQLHPRLSGQPLHRGHSRSAGDDLDLRGLDLFGGLRCVAAIGKQPRCAARYRQSCAGAGKSREVAEIGKVCNDEPGEPGTPNFAAQSANAAEVVHLKRITGVGIREAGISNTFISAGMKPPPGS